MYHNPWFTVEDINGRHWIQPDHLINTPKIILIVESKLHLRRAVQGLVQLQKTYQPAMEFYFNKPAGLLLAFNNWTTEKEYVPDFPMITKPEEIFEKPTGQLYGWYLF